MGLSQWKIRCAQISVAATMPDNGSNNYELGGISLSWSDKKRLK